MRPDEVLYLQDESRKVHMDEAIVDYMLAIVERTRNHESLALGVSPRGSQALYRAVQGLALVEGRDYAIKWRSAQGDMATLNGIMDAVRTERADLVIPFSTTTLQTAVKKIQN